MINAGRLSNPFRWEVFQNYLLERPSPFFVVFWEKQLVSEFTADASQSLATDIFGKRKMFVSSSDEVLKCKYCRIIRVVSSLTLVSWNWFFFTRPFCLLFCCCKNEACIRKRRLKNMVHLLPIAFWIRFRNFKMGVFLTPSIKSSVHFYWSVYFLFNIYLFSAIWWKTGGVFGTRYLQWFMGTGKYHLAILNELNFFFSSWLCYMLCFICRVFMFFYLLADDIFYLSPFFLFLGLS